MQKPSSSNTKPANSSSPLTWVNCLHIYQPPWQRDEIVRTITEESYAWIVAKLKAFPHLRLTLNIAGILLETLDRLGYRALITDIAKLARSGQVELTGSSKFHAFLPELPESEIIRQLELNEATLEHYFPGYKPSGFFLPELAYHPRIGSILKSKGYQWVLLDPIATTTKPADATSYRDTATGLVVVFRNRLMSKTFPPEMLFKKATTKHRKAETIITATDGELYGHFHRDWQDHLKQLMERNLVRTLTISEYLATCTHTENIRLHPASWETRSRQLRSNNPFSIWYNTANPIHRRLWRLAHYAIACVNAHTHDPNAAWARHHLDRGLASCSWWWASEIKTSPFAPIAWNPDEIEHGALELIKAVRSLQQASTREKLHAENIYIKLIADIWNRHWNTYGKRT